MTMCLHVCTCMYMKTLEMERKKGRKKERKKKIKKDRHLRQMKK